MNKVKEKTTPVGAEVVEQKSTDIVPTRNAIVKQTADIDGFLAKRQEFIQKVNAICVEGKDYHIIQGKKSLAKGGAEKIASIFQWNAVFEKDTDALEMLGTGTGLVAFKCTISKGNKFVGEGRGAASLDKNGKDPNKTLKMAQKSAFIDAVLRASGLSDFYTQDLEDMPKEQIGSFQKPYSPPAPAMRNGKPVYDQPTPKQKEFIGRLMQDKGYTTADLTELQAKQKRTPSELIEWLKEAPKKDETIIDASGDVIDKATGKVIDVPFN